MKERDKFRGFGSKWLTQGLFFEYGIPPYERVLYTTQTWDKEYKGKTYPSLHKLYVEMEDVAEFEFANTYFECYEHWLRIKALPFFKEHYAAMVNELNAKLRSKALHAMLTQLKDGTASQATLKYLADEDYNRKSAGRPSREQIDTEVKHQATLHTIYSNDLDRIKNA